MSKEPLLRISKRSDIAKHKTYLIRFIAILVALFISSIILLIIKQNPIKVMQRMFFGPLSANFYITQIINLATTLIILSLGISLAFKMKFWNIGAEGQILFGAIGASFFAINFSQLPSYILLPIMFIASFIAGGLWGLIPAIFKAYFKTNETLFTLMMNYIALNIVSFLQSSVWRDPNSAQEKIAEFGKNSKLPSLFKSFIWGQLHIGWIIAIILIVLVFIYMKKTKSGYEISVVGDSENTARYAGMNVRKIIMRTMFISGGICGIAGLIQVSGNNSTLSHTITWGLGFTAIITTWLSQLNPIAIFFTSVLFSIMKVGGGLIESSFQISPAASDMIQGIILFCVLGCEFFINYKITVRAIKNKISKQKEVGDATK